MTFLAAIVVVLVVVAAVFGCVQRLCREAEAEIARMSAELELLKEAVVRHRAAVGRLKDEVFRGRVSK